MRTPTHASLLLSRKLRPLSDAEGNIPAAGALLLFLSLTEARRRELKITVPDDDSMDTLLVLLSRLDKTDLYRRDDLAEVVVRRAEALGGSGDLFRLFVELLAETEIAEAARLCRSLPATWEQGTELALIDLARDALRRPYGVLPIPESIAHAMAKTALEASVGKSACVPWAASGELVKAGREAGLDVIGFSPDAISAGIASMLVALEGEGFTLGEIHVGRPDADESFDIVIASEVAWRLWVESTARRDAAGNPILPNGSLGVDASMATLGSALSLARTGGVVVALTSGRLTYGERYRTEREKLLEMGLDAACELGQGTRIMLDQPLLTVIRCDIAEDAPLLLASVSGESARSAGIDFAQNSREDAATAMASAERLSSMLANHEEIPFVSREISREELLSTKDASLRFSAHAESVDVATSLAPAEQWNELLAASRESQKAVRVAEESFATAVSDICELLE